MLNGTSSIEQKKDERRSMKIRSSVAERLFNVFNYALFLLLGVITVFPYLVLLAKSLSSEAAVISDSVTIFPVDLQWGTYQFVMKDSQFLNSMKISVLITVLGTVSGLIMAILTAYPLSKPRLRGRKIFILIFIFTMLFSGGLIPTYLLMRDLNLVNTLPVLFLPGMLNIFNMLIIKSFFEGIPDSLEESAKIDGASNVMILARIVVPLSMPVFATVALFLAVGLWNDYFSAMVYISTPGLKPMQLYLKEMLVSVSDAFIRINNTVDADRAMNASPQSLQAASIILATLPIILVYPFLQKYFVHGVMLGSVKE
jgi:putative aldouronate transport system permease protein